MYKRQEKQMFIEAFNLPFEGRLYENNRWVKLSMRISWHQVELLYESNFKNTRHGAPALSARMALAALIIKEKLGTTDEETVEQITENPYLQFFCGMKTFSTKAPFDPSMLVHFRKRFPENMLQKVNATIVQKAMQAKNNNEQNQSRAFDNTEPAEKAKNKGKLLVDATCAPADITYPTDLKLLNCAREKTEEIIDTLHAKRKPGSKKPKTYRRKARKQYCSSVKNKKHSKKTIRKNIRIQLGYVRRNLKAISKLATEVSLTHLKRLQYRDLLVIHEVYRQQQHMFDKRINRVDDRIVSISQPHVRPIKRGKAGADTEFGAKISVSFVEGFSFVDRISWDNFNESKDLVRQIENYKRKFGFYPKSVHADKIYRNRENRKFCKEHNIRLSGPKLGRPPKLTNENAAKIMKQSKEDEVVRNAIEGKFGQGKRRYSLDRIFTKLAKTSETVISLIFLVMNLQKWMAHFFYFVVNELKKQILLKHFFIFLTSRHEKLKNASNYDLKLG